MNKGLLVVCLMCLPPGGGLAQSQAGSWRLVGLINVGTVKCVALVNGSGPYGLSRRPILAEGQREDDIEVVSINAQSRSAEVRLGGTNLSSLRLPGSATESAAGIALQRAPFDQVVQMYSEFANRTVLRFPHMKQEETTLDAAANNSAEAARLLEQAFAEKGLTIIQDGDKFAMLLPKYAITNAHPHAPLTGTVPSANVQPAGNDYASDILPPGVICFARVPLREVAKIYAELTGRTLDPDAPFPYTGDISLRTQTSFSREEAIYALETLFGWSGVQLVPEGPKLARVVPVSR